jgi:hypothetical protein
MESNFEIIPSDYFKKQLEKSRTEEIKLINEKLKLIKSNPFRFKNFKGYRHVFKIKLNFKGEYSRLLYVVFQPEKDKIRIFGIFPRKQDYKDFKKFFNSELKKLKKK